MNNKTAWLFNHYAQEPSGAGGTRHFGLAKHMKDMGWNMQIIASSVSHADGKQRLEKKSFRCDDIDGISFVWLKTPTYKGNGFLRVLNMLVYTLRAYFGRWRREVAKPDVVIGSSVHPFAAIVAYFFAKKYAVPFVFEIRDLWPETIVVMGRWSEHSWKTRLFRSIEKWLYTKADKIVTLLPYAHEYIGSLGVDTDKVTWISNGVELGDNPPLLSDNKDMNFSLMYLGALGEANDIATLLNAMKILQDKYKENRIKLRLIGEGTYKSLLREQAKKLDLHDVTFESAVSKKEIPKIASQADAFVICVKDLPRLYRYGISMNKIFDYMAAARPIIISSNARNNPIADGKCGITVPAEDSVRLAEAAYEIANMSAEDRTKMGQNGRSYVENNFSYKVLAGLFVNVLNSAGKN